MPAHPCVHSIGLRVSNSGNKVLKPKIDTKVPQDKVAATPFIINFSLFVLTVTVINLTNSTLRSHIQKVRTRWTPGLH